MESIKNRTSIRKYANREVSDELLYSLIEEAEHTPTMGNLQLYSVVITRSEEGKKALAPAHFNQPMVTSAPVVLTICADYSRTTIWAENRKAHPGSHRCPSLHSDFYKPCRRSRSWHLFSRNDGIYAKDDNRRSQVT